MSPEQPKAKHFTQAKPEHQPTIFADHLATTMPKSTLPRGPPDKKVPQNLPPLIISIQKMSPSSTLSEETAKRLKSSPKADGQHKKSLEISKHSSYDDKKEKQYNKKARDNEMHVSSSSGSTGYEGDQIKKESYEDDEPRQKKPKYSVEIKKIEQEDQIYQPKKAESIKLREPKTRRNKSESYDESDLSNLEQISLKRFLATSMKTATKKLEKIATKKGVRVA